MLCSYLALSNIFYPNCFGYRLFWKWNLVSDFSKHKTDLILDVSKILTVFPPMTSCTGRSRRLIRGKCLWCDRFGGANEWNAAHNLLGNRWNTACKVEEEALNRFSMCFNDEHCLCRRTSLGSWQTQCQSVLWAESQGPVPGGTTGLSHYTSTLSFLCLCSSVPIPDDWQDIKRDWQRP